MPKAGNLTPFYLQGKHQLSLLQNWVVHILPKHSSNRPLTGLFQRMDGMLFLLVLVCAFMAQSSHAQSQTLVLDTESQAVRIDPPLEMLLDSSGKMDITQIEQQPDAAFTSRKPNESYLLGTTALWMRFDATVANPSARWRLAIPVSTLDEAALYYRNQAGQWVKQQAGDTLPKSSWTQRGRYPVFELSSEAGQSVRYYLQLRQLRTPYSTLPQIVSDAEYVESRQNEHMLLGIYMGFAALLAALAIYNAVTSRDLAFGIFALHIVMFAGSHATYTGLAGLYVWPEIPALNNAMAILLTLCAAATALWLARTICTPRRYSTSLDVLMLALMFLLPVAGVVDVFSYTLGSFMALNVLVAMGMAAMLIGIGAALYEGDRDTRWVALGFSPIFLAALFPLVRNLGFISTGFWTDYGRMVASLIEVPILFYGLRRRVSQSRNLSVRTTALRNTDPLTGLYSAKVLLTKMRQSLATAERYQLPFALLLVNLANLASLQKHHGRETADRAMVMAASRIRGIAHSTDTLARVGDAQFALLMEGPINAASANEVATKILASGLRPSNQLPDAEPLKFHIAVGHIGHEARVSASQAESRLAHMLQAVKTMDDGSRKAIRHVKF